MNTEAIRILDEQAKQESTVFENGMGTQAKLDNQELMFNDVDITIELPALDDTIVRESFTIIDNKMRLAGEDVKAMWNSWGQLELMLGKYKLKGRTLKACLKEIYEYYFDKDKEVSVDGKWITIHGTLLFGKHAEAKFLMRGETIIGVFREKQSVMKTINWYEKSIYKGKTPTYNRVHKTMDFKAETPHDVYDKMPPEFTKEVELEEIRAFLTSLRRRVLSNEEKEALKDMKGELDMLVFDSNVSLDQFTTGELEDELSTRY